MESQTAKRLETSGGSFQLNQFEVERRGRVHSCWRSLSMVVVGVIALLPVWAVCRGWLPLQSAIPPVVTGRVALLIGALLIPSYIQFGYRCWELVRSARAPRLLEQAATVGLSLTLLAGVMHAVKVVVVWPQLAGVHTYPFTLASGGWGGVGLFLLAVGLVVCLLAAAVSGAHLWFRTSEAGAAGSSHRRATVWLLRTAQTVHLKGAIDTHVTRAELRRWRNTLSHEPTPPAGPRPGVIICCSGGGIRSASFCLGGLQELHSHGIYQRAAAVVGVSGGGYIAAAMHVLRWQSAPDRQDDQPAETRPRAGDTKALPSASVFDGPFSTRSPELGWLRRNTDYLFSSARVRTQALLTLLTGLGVNLVLCVFFLGVLSWWFGWYFHASGAIRDWLTLRAISGDYRGGWRFLDRTWVVPAGGVVIYLAERAATRLWCLPTGLRAWLQRQAVRLIWLGCALYLLLVVMPAALVVLHNYAAAHDTPAAALITAVGLMPARVCSLVTSYGWCGASTTSVRISVGQSSLASLLAVLTAILAVLRSASKAWPSTSAGTKPLAALLARIGAVLRHIVVPWLAFVAVVIAGSGLLLRWSVAPLADPGLLARWHLIYQVLGLFLLVTVLTDVNWTSLHHFYRERIASAFFLRRTSGGLEPVPYEHRLRFSKADPATFGGPALVTCAVANVSDSTIVPAKRHGTPFVFSHDQIGLTDRMLPAGRRSMTAATYELAADYKYRDVTIPAATAMSGAAFSPLAGRMRNRIAPYRFLMALANARLGVWLPNPMWVDETRCVRGLIQARTRGEVRGPWSALPEEEKCYLRERVLTADERSWLADQLNEPADAGATVAGARRKGLDKGTARSRAFRFVRFFSSWFGRPTAFRLLKEAAGKTSVYDRKLYVTDGGHYDNLGLVEALRRQARVIYVLDASNDAENSFTTLGEAIATARMDLDCIVTVDWKPMLKPAEGRAQSAYASGSITYPDGSTGVLHVIKALLPTALPLDAEVYAGRHRDYPRTSTGDQLYGEFDLEAYRVLGEEATRSLVASQLKLSLARNGHRPKAVAVPQPAEHRV